MHAKHVFIVNKRIMAGAYLPMTMTRKVNGLSYTDKGSLFKLRHAFQNSKAVSPLGMGTVVWVLDKMKRLVGSSSSCGCESVEV
jgi:hypothetical protein